MGAAHPNLSQKSEKNVSEILAEVSWRELVIKKIWLTKEALYLSLVLVACWIIGLVNILFAGGDLSKNGSIHPRKLIVPFVAILWSFLLHDGFVTLILNSIFFFLLGSIVISIGMGAFTLLSIIVIIGSGIIVWCIGLNSESYFGISCLLVGYASFTITYKILVL